MQTQQIFAFSQNPWANGVRMALLNLFLAMFCAGTFFGTLAVVSLYNQCLYANGGSAADSLPFPFLPLFLLYAILLPVVWLWLGRRLPHVGRERMLAACMGAGSLTIVGFLGLAAAVGLALWNEWLPNQLPVASVFVFSGLAILILLASLVCFGLLWWQPNN